MRGLHRRTGDERGAALVETALIVSVLLVLGIGAAEFGFAFVDWLAVSSATREGARTGSAAGKDPGADTLILGAVDQAMAGNPNAIVQEIWIFKADANGVPEPASINLYTPSGGGYTCSSCTWPSASRSTDALSLDNLGVRVVFQHDWITGLLPWLGNQTWSDDTVFRLEPAQTS